MQILSVSLNNFKIHRDRSFEFQPGVNAICGENGAGKTSILEAIAWVLFNYDSDYRKDDLRHQDSKSATVRVRFISAFDSRTYDVVRKTLKGKTDTYQIYDPQLNLHLDNIHRIEDAVQWLRQHLGLPLHTDLAKLFADVIGIPQGTFTADFLKSPKDRRKVFDPILQVEDYKQAFQGTSGLEKYAVAQVEAIERDMDYYRQRLQDWESLKQEHQDSSQQLHQDEATLEELTQSQNRHLDIWERFKVQAEQVQQLLQKLELLKARIEQLKQQKEQLTLDLDRVQEAVTICEKYRSPYEAYRQIEAELRELNQQRNHRDQLYRQQTLGLGAMNEYKMKQGQLLNQIEQFKLMHEELERLAQDIPKQEAAEDQRQAIAEQLQKFAVHKVEQNRFWQQQQQYQQRLATLRQDIDYLQRLESAVKDIPRLEETLQRHRQQLAHLEAAQQFEAELQAIVRQGQTASQEHQTQVELSLQVLQPMQQAMPLFAPDFEQVQTTLRSGLELHQVQLQVLRQILQDLATQVNATTLQQQIQALAQKLEGAKRCQIEFARLATQQQQRQQLETDLAQIAIHLDRLHQALQGEEELQQRYQTLQGQLIQLGDPKGRSRIVQQHLQEEATVQRQWQELQQQQTAMETELQEIATKLQPYEGIDERIALKEAAREVYEADYLQYIQNERMAKSLAEKQERLQQVSTELEECVSVEVQAQELCNQGQQDFSPAVLQEAEQRYLAVKAQVDQLAGALPERRKALQQLEAALAQRQQWHQTCDRLQQTLTQKQQILRFIRDARQVYNHSSARITNFYLDEIRHEGDRLFRELMNRQGVALNWTEDYEIQVQEGAIWRSFRTLSGGEQMAAALAIRLALLKVLAELDVAFFDEPTTNMDRDRREQLAEALANLKTFRQLFVISHDDTFEHLTENVIRVERELTI